MLTINEEGKALTEMQDGVTMPVDYSFATVNDFVHGRGTQFEDMQGLCLGMASEIERIGSRNMSGLAMERDRYKKALEDICSHQKFIGGDSMAAVSTTYRIADNALKTK